MHLTITTPDKKIFEGNVHQVTVPGSAGTFQILQNHAPIVSTLQKGVILYNTETKVHTFAVEEGLIEVRNNYITVLVAAAGLAS